MKYTFQIIIILFICTCAQGQTLQLRANDSVRKDTVAKSIVDNVKYRVYYAMSYAKDSTFIEDRTECQTVLLVGNKYNAFMDYNALRQDSIMDRMIKTDKSTSEILTTIISVGKLVKFKPTLLKNYPAKGKNTVQIPIVPREKQRYIDSISINWTLNETKKEIAGYNCKQALCSFRGRDYVAWYTPDIPISEGPYVFAGLPGLILEITDTRGHYSFKVNGFVQIKEYEPIYIKTKNVVNTSREQTRKAVFNLNNNPTSITQSLSGQIKIDDETLAKVKAKPYNPIELE